MKIEWQEVSTSKVVDFFVKGFQVPKDKEIKSYESFYDPVQQKFILKLFIADK